MVPAPGTPDNTPAALSVTADGKVPETSEKVMGDGVPAAVTLNEPFVPTVKDVLLALEKDGRTGFAVGVTITVAEESPFPIAFVARTEHV